MTRRIRRGLTACLIGTLLCAPLLASRPAAAAVLRSGPMAGYSGRHEVIVWLMTDAAAQASLEYWAAGDAKQPRRMVFVRTNADHGFAAHVRLEQLDAGTRYHYRVRIDGQPLPGDPQFGFTTQPVHANRPRDFTIATGSCAYLSDAQERRDGNGYGDGYGIFEAIAGRKPDVMVWLGDSIYYRDEDFREDSAARMNARWLVTREFAPLQRLLQTGHHYAIWDDHDYGPNDSDRGFALKDTSLALFERYWANGAYGLSDTPGVFSKVRFEDVDIFLLDDRSYRDDDASADMPQKTMLGTAQLAWLKRELARSRATFKLIANGSRMLSQRISPERRGGEGWHNHPTERDAFLEWLDQSRIDGVFFVSGDIHYTHLTQRERPGTYPLLELTCSPLTSRVHPRPNPLEPVPGTVVVERNFCTLDFHGSPAARVLSVASWSADGTRLWERSFPASRLRKR